MPSKYWWGAAALALIVAFAAGRFTAAKPDVKTVEHVVAQKVEVKAEQKVEQKDTHTAQTVIVYRDRVVHTDGTVENKSQTVTTTGTDTHVTEHDATTDTTHAATTSDRNQTVSSYRPEWHVGVLAGFEPLHMSPQLAGPFALGAQVERRVLGPIWLGAWGMSSGMAGVSVSVEF